MSNIRFFKASQIAHCCGLIIAASSSQLLAQTQVLDTMVISATKLGVELSKTDSSMLVKTGLELQRAGVNNVKDLEKVFAGLVIQTRGNRTYASTTVRGMNSPDFYSPTINVLVDGVKQDSAFITQPLLNVERVEFLRGPQGTLYGSNAQGGVINIITRKDEDSSSIGLSYSNSKHLLEGAKSLILNDEFYADFSFRAEKEEGFIDFQGSNEKDANSSRAFSGALKLHYEPQEGPWDAALSIARDNLNSHEEWYLTEKEYSNKSTAQTIPELDREVESYSLSANYTLDDIKFTSISSVQNRRVDRLYIGGQWNEDQKTISQELRMLSNHTDQLTSLAGVYLEKQRFDGNAFSATNQIDVSTSAIFGQIRYALNEKFDTTVGARAAHISSSSDYSGNSPFGISAYNAKKSENLFSPKVAIGWQVNADSRVYFSLANGYRPGGFNRVPFGNNSKGYDSEKSISAELGLRTSALDEKLKLSGALYQINTDDVQLYTGNIPNQVLTNLGEARSRGLELDLNWQASNNFTLNFGSTIGKSEFRAGNNGIKGNRLTYAPDRTFTVGADYRLSGGDILLKANARHNSRVYFDEANSIAQAPLTLVDLAGEYTKNDINYRLFVNNVTDKEFVSYAYLGGNGIASNYGSGREIGLKVDFKW